MPSTDLAARSRSDAEGGGRAGAGRGSEVLGLDADGAHVRVARSRRGRAPTGTRSSARSPRPSRERAWALGRRGPSVRAA